jgi:hypothetical protein
MKKEFIPYEQALALKELGFDEECLGYYFNKQLSFGAKTSYGEVVEVPLYQQAFRWFRDKGYVNSIRSLSMFNHEYSIITGVHIDNEILSNSYYTYDEAELACLKKLIEIVKTK